ncbi:SMC-Scp complex subunit ScpB [Roseinatronobacter sp. S2]|uniref:SMC-Scp complex subunit ScpB n=1 Tax=Roseinatronobacter sp. S2 TaxID=3035471 RepID=UPI00240FFB73|nr:SMC-Scp complex subunit ScpB [Roseinatronobacter sp. S2]WFE74800.1 SMC-Scp complex subunit ScpB [Roseinatronobacter sp. S2]
MAKKRAPEFDRARSDLPPELRWSDWMKRIEAALLASARPVARDDLARVVGQGMLVDMLPEDVSADLETRPYEIVKSGDGWLLRTRAAHAPAIRAVADIADHALDLSDHDAAVLATIAYYQPVSRDGLKALFGKDISRDLMGRLSARGLLFTGIFFGRSIATAAFWGIRGC